MANSQGRVSVLSKLQYKVRTLYTFTYCTYIVVLAIQYNVRTLYGYFHSQGRVYVVCLHTILYNIDILNSTLAEAKVKYVRYIVLSHTIL